MTEHIDSPLVSKNGKRLPLRAFSYRELNRRFWSQGKVLFADALERNQPRELLAHEKQPEDMTLEELIATQDREPLSESKRSFLTTGVGVLHLDATDYDEGSIGEIVADSLSGIDFDDSNEFADEASSIGNGIAYEMLDPITAKQIDWEQRVWHESPVRTLSLADGKVRVNTSFQTKEEFTAVAREAIKALMAIAPSPRPNKEERIALAARLTKKFDDFVANEVERANAPDDDVMHGSFEDYEGLMHMHSPRGLSVDDRKNGPWHGTPMDRAEVSVYGQMDSDEDTEALAAGSQPCAGCQWGMTTAGESSQYCNDCYAQFDANRDVNTSMVKAQAALALA